MRILVVEDNAEIRDFLKKRLEEACFAVDVAEDGEKGSYAARTNQYDLILLDHLLPYKNGDEVCDEIRKSGIHTPIVMITVKSELVDKMELFNRGVDDYVTKPFFFDELLARVRAILRRPRARQTALLQFEDLTMDTVKQKVTRGEKDIYLTRKEFLILEYLLKNPGDVVSRGMLMEHAWDMSLDPFSNTIETHILNIRKKIDREHAQKLIYSVPGRGYKIDVQQ